MGAFWAITRNTLLETVRQPVFALAMILCCAAIGFLPALSGHLYVFQAGSGMEKPAARMIADLALSTVLMAGLLLAVYCSATAVSREIESKTTLSVLVKRVSRAYFLAAKGLGVMGAVTIAVGVGVVYALHMERAGVGISVSDAYDNWILAAVIGAPVLAVVAATLRNYYRGRAWIGSFTLFFTAFTLAGFLFFAAIDRNHQPVFLSGAEDGHGHESAEHRPGFDRDAVGVTYDYDVLRAGVLTWQAVMLLTAVALAASTRLSPGANLAASGVVFLLGLTGEFFRARAVQSSLATPGGEAGLVAGANLWHGLMPNFQHLWMSDALTRELPIPWSYVGMASVYTVLFVVAMYGVAVFLFERREIA